MIFFPAFRSPSARQLNSKDCLQPMTSEGHHRIISASINAGWAAAAARMDVVDLLDRDLFVVHHAVDVEHRSLLHRGR